MTSRRKMESHQNDWMKSKLIMMIIINVIKNKARKKNYNEFEITNINKLIELPHGHDSFHWWLACVCLSDFATIWIQYLNKLTKLCVCVK